MNDSPNLPSSLRLDDQGCINQDVACISCEYNLRTISPKVSCPECGKPVVDSLKVRLCFADPAWLKKLIRGLTVVLLGPVVYLIFGVSATLMVGQQLPGWLIALVAYLLFVISFIGHWLFTSAQWQTVASGNRCKHRKWTRVGLVSGTAVMLFVVTVANFGNFPDTVTISMMCISFVVMAIAVLSYARMLALLIPDHGLAKAVRWMMWMWNIYILFVLSGFFASNTISTYIPPSLRGIISAIMRYNNIGIFLLVIAGMVLLLVYRRRLIKILRQMGER